ncbi:hypothetical protein, partial [Halorubrum sp. Atlit-26R]|uniref:hypothetical protein n=1 Tax=Halorubrum sp. Atlit-26R TaxID=2282128 RepID=UPI001F2E731D
RWLDDISERLDQLDPIIVVSRHPISFFVLLNGPYAWMREQLEGGSNLFGGWDIVRVLHAHDDPPDVLRCLHGSVGTLESSNDRKQGLSSIDAVLDVLIEEVESVVLEGPERVKSASISSGGTAYSSRRSRSSTRSSTAIVVSSVVSALSITFGAKPGATTMA